MQGSPLAGEGRRFDFRSAPARLGCPLPISTHRSSVSRPTLKKFGVRCSVSENTYTSSNTAIRLTNRPHPVSAYVRLQVPCRRPRINFVTFLRVDWRFIHNFAEVPRASDKSSAVSAVILRLPLISSFNWAGPAFRNCHRSLQVS